MDSYTKHEKSIMNEWDDDKLYDKICEQSKNKPLFKFCDGPPFVSAKTLHFGHLLVGYIKDFVLRYKYMTGNDCLNKLGFDCHGLPIEMLVYNILGIKSNQDVQDMGIDKFNEYCKKVVNEFSGAWFPIYDRIGRNVNKLDTYKTMDTKFMESVWWSFNELWKKGLITREFEVMPYSIKCSTPLSNFEAGSAYKDIETESIFVLFPLKEDKDVNFVAWTTTPWTLPGHVALCVNENAEYILVTDAKGSKYVIADKCLQESKIKFVKKEFYGLGKDLIGKEYQPPFNFLKREKYQVISSNFVKVDKKDKKLSSKEEENDPSGGFIGTGIVHIAPCFGADDLEACLTNKIIKMSEVDDCCPINDEGYYLDFVEDYKTQEIFKANDQIIKDLKEKNIILRSLKLKHRYPHCPRTGYPLIYKAVKSFFIDVPKIKDQLLENNKKVRWIPEYVGSKRFHNWLSEPKPWCVSRRRMFGTPIPIWMSDDETEMECFGSIKELCERAGIEGLLKDIHPEFIKDIKIKSLKSDSYLSFKGDVTDCWMESGAVPFAQYHYPFENQDKLTDEFMTDFIAEGLDQTRGWFYTLSVLSTALFNKPPARTILTTGLILDENGVKFSKKLGNFKDPMPVLDQYGADVLRLYLLSSPAVRAEPLKFTEENIDQTKKQIIPWINAVNLYDECMKNLKINKQDLNYDLKTDNITDLWILSRINSLIKDVTNKIENYEIDSSVKAILEFVDDLTNWYLKLNRDRLKGLIDLQNQITSLSVLNKVLTTYCLLLAPFTPFLSEHLNKIINPAETKSVHLMSYPKADDFNNEIIELDFGRLQSVTKKIRKMRDMSTNFTSIKVPIKKMTLVHYDQDFIRSVKRFEDFVKDDLNILNLDYRQQKDFETYKLIPNFKSLGQKHKSMMNKIKLELEKISVDVLKEFYNKSKTNIDIKIDDKIYSCSLEDFDVMPVLNFDQKDLLILTEDFTLLMDLTHDKESEDLEFVRQFCSHISLMRKEASLKSWDQIRLFVDHNDVLMKYQDKITERLKCNLESVEEFKNLEPKNSYDKKFFNGDVKIVW
jgi:isoleucyl-tRNA synthetase